MLLFCLVFIIAMVYASVGHGGASGYLALLLLLTTVTQIQMGTSALVLNLLVSGLAFLAFYRAGHFSRTLTWPFLVTSIPAAMLGGALPISGHAYYSLLAGVLCLAALRLCLPLSGVMSVACVRLASGYPPSMAAVEAGPRLPLALAIGGGLGLVSGIVGVGGGIFLSPILLLFRWADAKTTAASSAAFIFLNSLSGLAGRFLTGRYDIGMLLPLVGAAGLGGWIGSRLGSEYLPNPWLCRILAGVLWIAAGKLWFIHA